MKIAILHPWFLAVGGAEQTAGAMKQAFPEADCLALLTDEKHYPESLQGTAITASSMNWMPAKYKIYRFMLPVWPSVVEQLDLRGYDVVISSDSTVMKGVLIDQNALHLCYCHSPMRCLWDLHSEYENMMPRLIRPIYSILMNYVRQWDFIAAQRVDQFVANSDYIAKRIQKYYRRDSVVIYPPVQTANGYLEEKPACDYYLSMGRLTSTKRIDLLIEACNRMKRRLVIAGAGREINRLKSIAGPTIEFIGRVKYADLPGLYANCRALMFAADEDFGIVPVEAQAYGRPVIAYGYGGSLETVRVSDPEGRPDTGVFFKQQNVDSIIEAIERFEAAEASFNPVEIRAHSLQFDTSIFISRLRALVETTISGMEIQEMSAVGSSRFR